MKINALAVASYLVQLAKEQNRELKLLGLIKRVYIVHGFSLAVFGKSILDERFDKVEAWKYGPVIPSVYTSFKHNEKNAITTYEKVMEFDSNNEPQFVTPCLDDDDIKIICDMVFRRYINFSDMEMVELTHVDNSPWAYCYRVGLNMPIPDDVTNLYYTKVFENIKKENGLK